MTYFIGLIMIIIRSHPLQVYTVINWKDNDRQIERDVNDTPGRRPGIHSWGYPNQSPAPPKLWQNEQLIVCAVRLTHGLAEGRHIFLINEKLGKSMNV